jgi:hypothetical protein
VNKIKTKTTITIFIILLLASLSFSLVAAAIESPADTGITADYNLFQDDDQDTISVKGTLTFKNTGSANETIKISAINLPVGYSSEAILDQTINAGSTATVEYTIKVPHSAEPGKKEIGKIKITDQNNNQLALIPLYQTTKSMLSLKEIEVEYTDEEGKFRTKEFPEDSSSSLDLPEKVKPGTEVTLTIRLDNLFHSKYDQNGELENIKITVEADDNEFFQDVFEEEYDMNNLEAGKDDFIEIKFIINDEADEDSYDLSINVEAEDGESVDYEIDKKITFELGREKDDLKLTKIEVNPAKITACDSEFLLTVEMKNLGTRDQKYAGLSVYNADLKINENIQNIELDRYYKKDNTWSKTFTFDLEGKNIKPGTYPLDIRTYYQKSEVGDTAEQRIVIEKCASGSTPSTATAAGSAAQNASTSSGTTQTAGTAGTSSTAAGSTATANSASSGTAIAVSGQKTEDNKASENSQSESLTSAVITKTVENPYTMNDLILAAFIIAIILVIALIVIFIMLLLR